MPATGNVGWKTADVDRYPAPYTGEHFMDDAVFALSGTGDNWRELYDPLTGKSLDLAFVITPEPSTILLLVSGILLLRRRIRS